MKLTKLFSKLWLSAAALLAFSACSNEDLPTQTTSEAPKTKKVRVEFTATKDNDNLRAVFGVDTSNDLGQLTGLQMPEKDVVLRIAVKQGDGMPLVQDIVFKKAQGRNYATYTGDISVPTDGTGAYKIAAGLLKEDGGEVFLTTTKDATIPFRGTTESWMSRDLSNGVLVKTVDSKISLNVPYITKWQDLQIMGAVAQSTTLYLEPQGTILRMRIKNEASSARTFHRIKTVSTAFVDAGNFEMTETNGAPTWLNANNTTIYLTIPNGVEVQGNGAYSEWFYYWIMPRKLEQIQRNSVISLSQVQDAVEPSAYKVAFYTDKQLPAGSVPLTLVHTEGHDAIFGDLPEIGEEWGAATTIPKMSIEYISDYALDNTGTTFVSDYLHTSNNVGFFSWGISEQATKLNQLKTGVTIGGTKWHLPTRDELASVFIPEYDRTGYGSGKLNANTTTLDVFEPSIKIGTVTQSYTSDYYVSSNGTVYALRFKNKSNKWRTAFRYTRGGSTTTNDVHIKVECIYVGTENITLDDVKKDADFWTARSGAIKSKTFPLYGTSRPDGRWNIGTRELVQSATQVDESAYYNVVLSGRRGVVIPASTTNGCVVYLFRN